MENVNISGWFDTEKIDNETYVISEYRHWEETHCYLLNGTKRSLLIDTGLGISNIYDEVKRLTEKSVTAVVTHVHWDHIGGLKCFPEFGVHSSKVLGDHDIIDIGGRRIEVIHTPGHSPGHHSMDIHPEIMSRMRKEFSRLKKEGRLCHGSGIYEFDDWSVKL